MFYIYAKAPSTSAVELAARLGGVRLRRFDGFDFYLGREPVVFKPEDRLICWGSTVSDLDDVRVLNHGKKSKRYYDLRALSNNGIPVIRASEVSAGDIKIGRLNNAHDGSDLLSPPMRPDFYIRKENF